MMSRLSLPAAFLALSFTLAPACAQSASASAALTGFSYRLIDLDLTDSITPTFTFTERWNSYSSLDINQRFAELDYVDTIGTTSVTRPFGAASTTSGATSHRGEAAISALGSRHQQFRTSNSYGMFFALSPFTRIEFSATATIDAASQGDQMSATSWISFNGVHFDTNAVFDKFETFHVTHDGERDLSLSGFLETGRLAADGAFSIDTLTSASSQAAVVPEPSTYAMLLAGLGLLGWRARRTSGRQAE